MTEASADDAWVIDGNYSTIRDIVWPRAQLLVWLGYSFLTSFRQLFVRTAGRVFRREELWSGNRERLRTQLFTRDSIFWWLITTHRTRRREYRRLLDSGALGHLSVVRLTSRKETLEWLDELLERSTETPPA